MDTSRSSGARPGVCTTRDRRRPSGERALSNQAQCPDRRSRLHKIGQELPSTTPNCRFQVHLCRDRLTQSSGRRASPGRVVMLRTTLAGAFAATIGIATLLASGTASAQSNPQYIVFPGISKPRIHPLCSVRNDSGPIFEYDEEPVRLCGELGQCAVLTKAASNRKRSDPVVSV
jgi:hypothetical protein